MAPRLIILLFIALVLSGFSELLACSMYKLTVADKTMVGNNEDSWRQTSIIRFEPGTAHTYGVAYVGYSDKPHPDGAMNEFGLVFDAFTMPSKPGLPAKDPHKADFSYARLTTIMQQCKTVDEVYTFLERLNLHTLNGSPLFNGGMLLFVDRSGEYLVAEADALTRGNDAKFVLANFSYADTKDLSTVHMERYRKGVTFLENRIDTSLAFCTALSDTMSVHRPKIGDGTLYTTIYDLKDGLIHTYFFHDFSKHITFNLPEELAKGKHTYRFADLFPNNEGYQTFIRYQTPQNNRWMFAFIVCCGLLFGFSFLYFTGSFIMAGKNSSYPTFRSLRLAVALLCLALGYYTFVLLKNQSIYYFPAPYSYGGISLQNLTSYLPFVLLLAYVPLCLAHVKLFRQKAWGSFSQVLFAANNLAFLGLMGLFAYWGLFGL